ncbi:Protein-methionine sulfoxide oxidase MICAL3 [Armadillidium nasatum]|uniref:Protein-methionine sulfoxide oxidase MICAL3 n=1 Tax=Armadillidium nasatum TaxID=96803 RepID=A0A5N5SU99_9CRUS|nr:Protein-methionine sulfoxide oxidase MICAL3 [Armadillidium nasatum]
MSSALVEEYFCFCISLDMIRAVGKLEKTDWNISAIERKIEENPKPIVNSEGREKVPKWSRDTYNEKYQNIERRLRENGEDEERIAKYLDIDASLKRLERKLREGSTLETGLRGHNKVSNLANQLSSKLVRKDDNSSSKSVSSSSKQTRAMVLPSRGSDLCYFCNTRVYLVERLSAEGKFFHRQCFKCSYCGALLRLGNYIYDRENRYGGKFFCVPHFGLSVRSRGLGQKTEKDSVLVKDEEQTPEVQTTNLLNKVGTGNIISEANIAGSPKMLTPPLMKVSSAVDRGTTPERVEFENSVIEHSDEEEYLSEEEWTDRNFGASANELDDDDDSDYSDLSDEEVDEEALLETSQKLTVDETRRLAESWKRRYSNDMLLNDDDQESFSESDENDFDYVSEHGAEGDESHTPTEGEIGEDDDDDDDDEGENVRRARELRRLEVNINVGAPPRKAETSDSGSETEVGSEDESDTQIDTDSEFEEDLKSRKPPKEIPTIVIDETPVKEPREESSSIKIKEAELKKNFSKNSNEIVQFLNSETEVKDCNEKEGAERSASLSNLLNSNIPNPHTEQLKRLLQRTESSEFVSAQRNQLRRQYLLGNTANVPRKSVSTADLGNKFKSFMDKISETQKKLNPAPQPSPAMQAFLNLSNKSNSSTSPLQSSFLNQKPSLSLEVKMNSSQKLEAKPVDSKTSPLEEDESSDSSKSEEGKLITFSNVEDVKSVNEIIPRGKSKDEKGALDSEQSEKTNVEKEFFEGDFGENCVSAKNINLIETFNEDEQAEAINVELINTDDVDNVSESSSYHCNEDDVEADFDQLANDAMTELNESKLTYDDLGNVNFDEEKEREMQTDSSESSKISVHAKDGKQSNIKDEITQESNQQYLKSSSLPIETIDTLEPNSKKCDLEEVIVKDIGLSPETEVITTEADLSDWGDENEAFSIHAEDFETDFHEDNFASSKTNSVDSHPKLIARIASLESLGDSDSATSVNDKQKQVESTLFSTALTEPEVLNYVDISDSENSSENTQSFNIQYNKLQDAVITRSESASGEERVALIPQSPCLVSESSLPGKGSEICFSKTTKSKSLDTEETFNDSTPTRSLSDPQCKKPCISDLPSAETSIIDSSSDSPSIDLSNSKLQSPGRYEGYIPRFKGRVTPFSLARDSIDVRKGSVPKPLFTPSKEDILERERNEASRLKSPVSCKNEDSSHLSNATSNSHRVKDGDLVRDMVLSRINKKSNDKTRRGSRSALHLSLHSSSSSIFGSEPSLDTSKFSLSAENESPALEKFYTTTNINNSTGKDNGNGTVPSEGNLISRDFNSDISCKLPSLKAAVTKNSEEEKVNCSSRNILPATPLTHPEKFNRDDLVKKEIFKSSPQLNQASFFSSKLFQPTNELSSPDKVYSQRYPSELPVLSKQNVHLSTSLATNVHEPHAESSNHRITSGFRDRDTSPPQSYSGKIDVQETLNKDQTERLKELLEERRRKENEDDIREVRLRNKDICIQDCLEEYRQKRSSAPVLSPSISPNREMVGANEPTQTRIQLVLPKRHSHRPSLLELESMQIFSSIRDVQENTPTTDSLTTHLPNLRSSDSVNNVATSVQSPSTPTQNESTSIQEKKPIKKSKDRERRRSLIQVVAGMFTKSDEKKKEKEADDNSQSPVIDDKSLSPSSNLSSVPPKSPSVKERFSKLRLSRSKKKSSSSSKMRSSSVGTNTEVSPVTPENEANSLSLPTSPSRTLFSFLSSSVPARLYDKNKTSSSEENNSEEESNQEKSAIANKDSTLSTPSLRRQRAAQRAAKQAEQKRLRMAQEIQRQLEECEVKTRELEERGINVEKALTGETDSCTKDEGELMKEWFSLVHEKNVLVRWQEELTVKARELELEDRHLRLENELRQRMTSSEREKTREDIEREGQILGEIISIIEQKDALVNMLEEDRQRYIQEDRDLELVHARKILQRSHFERETGVVERFLIIVWYYKCLLFLFYSNNI